jgi:nitrogen fixation NifU-like protein
MNTEFDDLYKQVILDHNKSPRNFGVLQQYSHHAEGHNPLCGDQVNITLVLNGDVIEDLKFSGTGCAISKASASIMTTLVKGKIVEEAKKLFDEFHEIITKDPDAELDMDDVGKLVVFSGVREYPSRIKCASLPWHTLLNALENAGEKELTV